jgi:hypothetical protein
MTRRAVARRDTGQLGIAGARDAPWLLAGCRAQAVVSVSLSRRSRSRLAGTPVRSASSPIRMVASPPGFPSR